MDDAFFLKAIVDNKQKKNQSRRVFFDNSSRLEMTTGSERTLPQPPVESDDVVEGVMGEEKREGVKEEKGEEKQGDEKGKKPMRKKEWFRRPPPKKTHKFRVRPGYAQKEVVFVKEALLDLGLEESSDPNHWDVLWVIRFFREEFVRLAPFQKVNYMPGTSHICRKDLLHRSIMQLKQKFPNDPNFDFWPEGYNLEDPAQLSYFRSRLEREGDIFIVKKPFSSNGRGIGFVTCGEEMDELLEEGSFVYPLEKHKPLAQKYIQNPCLLEGYKFSCRVYATVTSVDPLRVYISHNGLLRICSNKFSSEASSFKDPFAHNDSYELNSKFDETFTLSSSLRHEGLRVTLNDYLEFVERENGVDVEKVWKDIGKAIALSIIAGEGELTKGCSSLVKQRSNAFEFLGCDIMFTEDYHVHILEVNHTPALGNYTELENEVKRGSVRDMFGVVDVKNERKERVKQLSNEGREVITHLLAKKALPKRMKFLRSATTKDIWTIVDTVLENEERGKLRRVLPDVELGKYMLENRNGLMYEWFMSGLSLYDLTWESIGGKPEEKEEEEEEGEK